jgi:hypothetical protein
MGYHLTPLSNRAIYIKGINFFNTFWLSDKVMGSFSVTPDRVKKLKAKVLRFGVVRRFCPLK